ncbi:MAG: DNA-directed RNA polymerase subunit alpha [Chloroflexi bacterium]|nr:DNA-directed RNA polymerase subunit alpha [Chloroflexota bacterium]
MQQKQTTGPKIELIEEEKDYGRFIMEPLRGGFGTTLGNALRRVLLSSLRGTAITAVKVEGTFHEFTTIPHMREDVSEFLLNVKEVRLRSAGDQPGRLLLTAAGKREVKAGDIQPSADFEVVNPDLHLATLVSPQAKLEVEFMVDHGQGYLPAAVHDGTTLGVIPVDAIYTPVRKVNYRVENTRVGPVTNYDRLILEVWTDGTITPKEAVSESAAILVEQFSYFRDLSRLQEEMEAKQPLGGVTLPPEQYNLSIDTLNLSARTRNCLKRASILSIGQLLDKGEAELLKVRNFGEKSLMEVLTALASHGFAVTFPGREAPAAPPAPEAPPVLAPEEPPQMRDEISAVLTTESAGPSGKEAKETSGERIT